MNVKNAIVQGENYRFTVLTPSMIRMEYSEKRCVCRQEDSDGCK